MSSELVVRAVPTIHSPTQGASSNKGEVVRMSVSVDTETAHESKAGKQLPNHGSVMPATPKLDNTSNTIQDKDHPLTSKEVLEAVQNLNDFVQKNRRELNFSVDELTGHAVVKVIDYETKDVIRQIPAEEILDVARRVAEQDDGKGSLLKVEV